MSLAAAQVTSRSNSDGLQIRFILENTDVSPEERMVLVEAIVHGWDHATAGSAGRAKAEKRVRERNPLTFSIRDSEK